MGMGNSYNDRIIILKTNLFRDLYTQHCLGHTKGGKNVLLAGANTSASSPVD